jgi:Photosynthesis affected mutant 68
MSSTPPKEPQKRASDDSTRKPMPFEPANPKSADSKTPASKSAIPKSASKSRPKISRATRAESGIPEVVSRRMIQRMALFSGIPSALGMSTFVMSYWVVSQGIFDLPTYAVLFVSLGWFGLGVVGLTYGVLSASWEEDSLGSKIGLEEFKVNWGRMTETWQKNGDRKT